MYSASQVDELFSKWKEQGYTKEELIIKAATACIGWPYVWGAVGAQCTPEKRKYYAQRSSCPAGEVTQIYKKCQYYTDKGEKSGKGCGGCEYYPENMRVLINDCQGFVKNICGRVGITFTGGGATSMWNGSTNWAEKGTRSTLPEKLCCIFWQASDKKTMSHIGFYIGGGWMIHCSGSVKKEKISGKVTHWAIPRGLGGETPMPWRPTIRRGSKGEDVKYVQQILIDQGYDLGSSGADGVFGAKTEAAVRAFQKKNGLVADGVVGPLTYEALEKVEPAPGVDLYTIIIRNATAELAESIREVFPDAEIRKEGD